MEALIIRVGFWGPLYNKTIRNTQNSIGNYLSPYSRLSDIGIRARREFGLVGLFTVLELFTRAVDSSFNSRA